MGLAFRVLRNLLVLGLLVAGAVAGCQALQPPTAEEVAADHLDAVVDELGQGIAHRLRGATVTSGSTGHVREVVVSEAADHSLAVGVLGSGDDGGAAWVELRLLSHYEHEGAFGSWTRYDVSGCVRIAATHGKADVTEDTDPRVTSRSVPCPPGGPPPAEPYAAERSAPAVSVQVDDVDRHSHDIEFWTPPCYGTSGYCPGG